MDLKMEVYTPALELVGMLEIQSSVIWEEKAFTAGSFSIESLITNETRTILVPENIIWIEGDTAGIIEHIDQKAGEDGPYITVKGRTLTGILDRRILWGQYNLSGSVPDIMRYLVSDCCINPTRGDAEARKIPGLVLEDYHAFGSETVQLQKTGGTLLEALETLGEAYNVAFGVRFNPRVPQMEFWCRPGTNRSIHQNTNDPVFYSTELDDVLKSEYTYDSSRYRNIALVAGEGEGSDRKTVVVEEDVPEPPTPPEPPVTEMYSVTLLVDPDGGGTASGGKTVAAGTSITVTANPADGYTFAEWRENGVMVSTSKSYTFTVNSDRTLTAVFAAVIPVYDVSVTIDPLGGGNVTGAGKYNEGTTVNLKATANDGYNFQEWKEDGQSVHNGPEYSFTAEKNRALVAAFSEIPSSKLPDGYTELEYIQSSGTQYIDTGIKPTGTIKISVDVEILDKATTTDKYVFGSNFIGQTNAFLMCRWNTAGIGVATGIPGGSASYTVISNNITPRRMIISVDYPNKKASIQGESEIELKNVEISIYMRTMKLFASPTGASGIGQRVYSAHIENSDGAHDYVPCTNPSGEAGLYDIIGGAFYGNAGTGAFSVGPAV